MNRPATDIDESTYAGRIAARLRHLRHKAGLNAEDAAAAITRAGWPCNRRTIFRWESGVAFSFDAVPSIAKAYGVKPRTVFPEK